MGSPAGANMVEDRIDGTSALRAGEIGTGLLAAMERVEAEAIVRIVEFDSANLTSFLGYSSAVQHLEVEAGLAKADAVRLHRLVTHCRRFPRTGRALEDGGITVPYLEVLAAAAQGLVDQYETDEAELPGLAEGRDVEAFARQASNWRWRHLDGHKDAEQRFNERHVTIQRRFDGSGKGSFSLDPIGMEIVDSALDTQPDPASSVAPCRSLKQRRADKLVSLLAGEVQLECDDEPTGRVEGLSSTVDVVIDLVSLENRQAATVASIRAEFASGSPISKHVVGQLVCDASYRRVIVEGPSQVIDVGAPTRQIPIALRRAVQVRDLHCQFAGCNTRWGWCDVHHLKPVSEGGNTSERNLALVCSPSEPIETSGMLRFCRADRLSQDGSTLGRCRASASSTGS